MFNNIYKDLSYVTVISELNALQALNLYCIPIWTDTYFQIYLKVFDPCPSLGFSLTY